MKIRTKIKEFISLFNFLWVKEVLALMRPDWS